MLLLVRHGQSQANVDLDIMHTVPDCDIQLTDIGVQQAHQCGRFLANKLETIEQRPRVVLWTSGYARARHTAQVISGHFAAAGIRHTQQESIHLIERNFGLVATQPDFEVATNVANLRNHYHVHGTPSRFFAKPPLGESPHDLALRIDQFFHTRLINSKDINIIVCHGHVIRAFEVVAYNRPYEAFFGPTPANCSVHVIGAHGYANGSTMELFTPSITTE